MRENALTIALAQRVHSLPTRAQFVLDSTGRGRESEAFHPKAPVCLSRYFKQFQSREKHMIYADPGSGVLIWQLLLAVFFGGTFYFTKLRHWAIAKIRPEHNDVQQESSSDVSAAKSISHKD